MKNQRRKRAGAGRRAAKKGKKFEALVAEQADWFERNGHLMMFRIPDPLKRIGGGQIRKDTPTFADFAGCTNNGVFFGLEAKSTENPTSFSFSLVRPVQRDRLAAVRRLNGIAFILARRDQKPGTMRRDDMDAAFEFYALPVNSAGVIADVNDGTKSIKWTLAKHRGFQLSGPLDWLSYVQEEERKRLRRIVRVAGATNE